MKNQVRHLAAPKSEVYASFMLGQEEFALGVQQVQEVVKTPSRIVPLPLAPDFVCGFFDLRGGIIPLIDMARLLDRTTGGAGAGSKTVVVDHHGVRLGLLFDDTSRVIRCAAGDIAAFDYADGSRHQVVRAVIRCGESLVRLIDLARLSTLGDVPHAPSTRLQDIAARAGRTRRRCVSFRVGSARLAFAIDSVFEIVPLTGLQPSPLNDPLCAGVMRIRSRTVPIIHFSRLLNASETPAPSPQADAEQRVIVLERGDAYVGLRVDAVDAIESHGQDDLMPVPALTAHRQALFAGCLDFGERGHVFLLSAAGVLALPAIDQVLGQQSQLFKAGADDASAPRRRQGLRQPFLWIATTQDFALPMKSVREIVDEQHRLVNMPGAPDCVCGMLNLRGQMVPVVDMRAFYRLAAAPEQSPLSKIVVLDQGETLVGLRVDAVRSILHVDATERLAVPGLLRRSLPASLRADVQEVIQASDERGDPVHLLMLNHHRLFEALTDESLEPADA